MSICEIAINDTMQTLFDRCDVGLYRAKALGRDTIVCS